MNENPTRFNYEWYKDFFERFKCCIQRINSSDNNVNIIQRIYSKNEQSGEHFC